MNLLEYSKLEKNQGDFISFAQNGETKILRFCYASGGEKAGEDIAIRKKKWDDANHKYVYDTEDGTWMAALRCIEYDANGGNPRIVRWERSAYFVNTYLIPLFKNFPRIIDGVWKVTASNPKTTDASYSFFPLMNADVATFPIPDDALAPEPAANPAPATNAEPAQQEAPAPSPAPEAPKKKKYWEE